MRASLLAVLVLATGLLCCRPGRAGLYNLAEPWEGPSVDASGVKPLGFSQFEDLLSKFLSIGVAAPLGTSQSDSPSRKHYLARTEELQAKARTGRITTEERVNLSAYLIRLRRYDQAIELLEPVAVQERLNFMLFANLGTAHQLAGHLDRALAELQQVRALWPTHWPGLTPAQLAWLATVEKYHRELVKLRFQEMTRSPAGRSRGHETLDDLFRGAQGSVRFLGDDGRYAAGKLAATERAKLPADALAIVQQLVLWLPEDTRLYWLLGELYNAEGDVAAAAKIFDDCVGNVRRFSAPPLREHRLIVREAQPKAEGPLVEVPAGPSGPASGTAVPPAASPSWLPERRQVVIVGGIAGLVVLALGYFQVREMRRRQRGV